MKFLQRTHFCPRCEKDVYFFNIVNEKTLQKDYKCPRCQNNVISYWKNFSNKYIIPYLIGTPFFAASAIYGLWTSIIGPIRPVDIFIMILNVLIAAIIVVNGMRFKKKSEDPQETMKSIEELKVLKKQNLWIILFSFIGFIFALTVDVIIFFIWKGIETALA